MPIKQFLTAVLPAIRSLAKGLKRFLPAVKQAERLCCMVNRILKEAPVLLELLFPQEELILANISLAAERLMERLSSPAIQPDYLPAVKLFGRTGRQIMQ